MPKLRELADLSTNIVLSPAQLLTKGYLDYLRYRLTFKGFDGVSVTQTRDIVQAGKVVAVLPIDLAHNEIVLIRQVRLSAHLANGCGNLVEIVAGRVEPNESLVDAARRECAEEIGVVPSALVELFTYLTTPGITDEEVTLFLAAVDAEQAPARPISPDGEHLETLCVSIDAAVAAVAEGRMRNGPLVIALQWLALNRERLAALLANKAR